MALGKGSKKEIGNKPNLQDTMKKGAEDFKLALFTELEEAKDYVKQGKMPNIKGIIENLLGKLKGILSQILNALKDLFDLSGLFGDSVLGEIAKFIFNFIVDKLGIFGASLGEKNWLLGIFMNDCIMLSNNLKSMYNIKLPSIEDFALLSILMGLICNGDKRAYYTSDAIFGTAFSDLTLAKVTNSIFKTADVKDPVSFIDMVVDRGLSNPLRKTTVNSGINALNMFDKGKVNYKDKTAIFDDSVNKILDFNSDPIELEDVYKLNKLKSYAYSSLRDSGNFNYNADIIEANEISDNFGMILK